MHEAGIIHKANVLVNGASAAAAAGRTRHVLARSVTVGLDRECSFSYDRAMCEELATLDDLVPWIHEECPDCRATARVRSEDGTSTPLSVLVPVEEEGPAASMRCVERPATVADVIARVARMWAPGRRGEGRKRLRRLIQSINAELKRDDLTQAYREACGVVLYHLQQQLHAAAYVRHDAGGAVVAIWDKCVGSAPNGSYFKHYLFHIVSVLELLGFTEERALAIGDMVGIAIGFTPDPNHVRDSESTVNKRDPDSLRRQVGSAARAKNANLRPTPELLLRLPCLFPGRAIALEEFDWSADAPHV